MSQETNPTQKHNKLKKIIPRAMVAGIASMAVGSAVKPAMAEAAPKPIVSAETHKAEVGKFNKFYQKLTARAESVALGEQANPTPNTVVTVNPNSSTDGQPVTVTEMTSGSYDARTKQAQLAVVSVYKPKNENQQNGTKPGSVFEISIYDGHSDTEPTSIAQFDEVAKNTAYSFSLTREQDGEWNLSTQLNNQEQGYAYEANYNTSIAHGDLLAAEQNQAYINTYVNQAAYIVDNFAAAGADFLDPQV